MICIWCRKTGGKQSLEHAIPESLGCPNELELRGVVCERCNNGLASLDQALLKQFEFLTVRYGIQRKGGKSPTIDGWKGMRSISSETGPTIFLNGGPGAIQAGDGKTLKPTSVASGVFNVWVDIETGKAGFTQRFGDDPRFMRGLYKIALTLVAKFYGSDTAASSAFDHVRDFVLGRDGKQSLTAAMLPNHDERVVTGTSHPIFKDEGIYPLFFVKIIGITFVLDLCPQQTGLRDLQGVSIMMGYPIYTFPKRN